MRVSVAHCSNSSSSASTPRIIETMQWENRAYIAANQIPFSVFLPWLVVSYLVGFGVDEYDHMNKTADEELEDQRRSVLNATQRRRRASLGCDVHIEGHTTPHQNDEGRTHVSRTRRLIHRVTGRMHLGAKTTRTSDRFNSFVENQLFFNTLSPKKALEDARAPFSDDAAFMHHLLKYPDFKRKKKHKRDTAHHAVEEIGDREKKVLSKEESLALLGQVDLKNADAQSLVEECEQYAEEVVESVFSLRGMDMFLGDEPEELIYRQPILHKSGLRKTPTFIGNLMMPFGNMTVYFKVSGNWRRNIDIKNSYAYVYKMPKWVKDWSNLPDETEDDSPDVRALKRWLRADDEYRRSRLKVIPYIVDGPIAIRLIKPKAAELTVHGEKTPVKFAMVPGNQNDAPLMECDIDLVSNATIRKLANMIRHHLKSIVIDVAFIISKPSGSAEEEPSACLGCWRIDRIDFEKAGVFPEKPLEEIADTMKEVFAN